MSINSFANQVHKNAVAHGWWETERGFPEIIALIHSELSEALEEYRAAKPALYYPNGSDKPEGIGVELADAIIRILDYCAYADIDIEKLLKIKHEYNKSRPYKHGGKVC